MINPKCNKCGNELAEYGGLAFSPPIDNIVIKLHICKHCWELFLKWINRDSRKDEMD